ncbi:hypothetical protein NDU88_002484 [Pleurodeles waltl]|uniref:Uncharacterized protein n=1 Tax=Pleurodeles waltl TaxID=8319 RepID=A0AAV7LDW1_PLEWA|nr:hypothetical protein NDU88_002484 [Pleurodeles waltl]
MPGTLQMCLPHGPSHRRVAGRRGEAKNATERFGASGIKPWAEAARVFRQGRRGLALCHRLGAPVSRAFCTWRSEAVNRTQLRGKTPASTVGEDLYMMPVKLRARGVSSGLSVASKQQQHFY